MNKYIKIMRLDHWIKQLFILPGFICMIFLNKFNISFEIILKILIALFSTSLIASANYTINEYLDAKYDKYHPTKKNRPLVNKNINGNIIFIIWLLLGITGLTLSYFFINNYFFICELWLLIMGLLYNVEPFRTKDIFILDVLSESLNNAIRFLLGWFIIKSNTIIPISIVLGYWLGGAFLMATKRYAELKMIANKEIASLYRKSFKYYSEETLLTSAFFYAICSVFFIGIFLIKYRIELILAIPFIVGLFCFYLHLAFKKDSAVQKPEKLYHEKGLLLYCLFLIILFSILMYINIPWLNIFYN